jgi:hypothetical protein
MIKLKRNKTFTKGPRIKIKKLKEKGQKILNGGLN